MSTANGPLSDQTIRALRLYQSQKYTEVRAFAENELYKHSENFGLRFVSGLAACRLGDPDIGVSEIKKARAIIPQISDYYCMEAVNWQRGIVNFVDHLEANFFSICQEMCDRKFFNFVS